MTIPIDLAIRAVRLHINMCDAVDPTRWDESECEIPYVAECQFVVAARAGYKATLEYLLFALEEVFFDVDAVQDDWPIAAAVCPLISHLDATRPNWRTE
jgi:hypothetical protein